MTKHLLKLEFYVPKSHCESVLEGLFEAGAGHIGGYERCCWITLGKGRFRPSSHSNPYVGEKGRDHYEDEYKVELVLKPELRAQVLKALLAFHPYETPAYGFINMQT